MALLVGELRANGHVLLKDGSSCDGAVMSRPNVRVFGNPDQQGGINATVQWERPDVPDWRRHLWLDQIVRAEQIWIRASAARAEHGHAGARLQGLCANQRHRPVTSNHAIRVKPSALHASLPTP
jgi:hypothetical protein